MGARGMLAAALYASLIATGACSKAPRVSAPSEAPVGRIARQDEPSRTSAPVCSHDDVRVAVDDEIVIPCDPSRPCTMALTFQVDNCTDEDVAVVAWGLRVGAVEYGFDYGDAPIAVGRRSRTTIKMPDDAPHRAIAGAHALRVQVAPREDPSSEPRTLEAGIVVRDPIKERAKSACLARGGDWIDRGHYAGDEVCAEVMKDAGKTCQDRRDCQGACELVSETVVSATKKRVAGTCTRHRSELGCHHYIGETEGGLMARGEAVPRMCAD